MIFMNLINHVFAHYLDKFGVVLIDDILIYSKNREECTEYLRIVLQILREQKLHGKLSKCKFWLDKNAFFSHIVFGDGVSSNPKKVGAVMD